MVDPVKRRGKGRTRWIFVGIAVLLVAFIWYRHSGHGAGGYGGRGGRHGTMAVQAVGVAKVVSGSMPEVLDELGTVTPVATVTVLPQLSGYLTQVAFTQGEDVTQGQFLAEIDPRPYQIQLEQYEATLAKDSAALAQARSDLARYEVLARQQSIAEQQVTDQQFLVAQDAAAVQVDQANIDSAKLDLVYCHITSPVAGRIGLRLVDPGNYVTPGSVTGIAVVTTIAPTTVIFSVAQSNLAAVLVRLGQGATLQATAYSSDDTTKLEDGTLSAVDNMMNTSTGMVKLRADFANADKQLFPNEFVNVHLLVNTLTNATLVPSPAVQTGAPGTYVYVVDANDTVSVQPVTTGPSNGTDTVITKGLTPGQTVVVDGVDRLTAGAKVSVVTAPGTQTAAAAGNAAPSAQNGQMAARHRHHGGNANGQPGAPGETGSGAVSSGASPPSPAPAAQ
ncbi:efflux RND transporter periplasmic adaptor subunit [Acidocella sp.]|uniref:efflux RND transporter periplasmic adaptor subunit n=1 Tax=Acidocella sp. TaxID=50710 RepID=UPI002F4217CE